MNYSLRRRLYLFGMNKLHLPRIVISAVIKGLALALDPLPWLVRGRAAKRLLRRDGTIAPVPEAAGYRLVRPDELPGSAAAVAACRRIFAAARDDLRRKLTEVSKPFLVPVTRSSEELMACPEIRDFVLSPELLAVVARYFGTVPVLSNLHLFWTPPNNTMEKSQKYHFDTEDYRQLKLFINVFDVDAAAGPLTLLPADASQAVSRRTGYVGGRRSRMEDEQVSRVAPGNAVQALAPAGGGILIDTSRCLHFGSRGNRRERLVLQVQFMGYYAPKIEPVDWRRLFEGGGPQLSEAARLAVRC